MKQQALTPIPIPLAQRWHWARRQVMPALVFVSVVFAIGILWRGNVGTPTMVGQVEAVVANVNCHKAGVLVELNVSRFQSLKAGDTVGRVMIADPRVLASSLAVLQSEIEMLRADLAPIAQQQRAAVNYTQLRLNWMKQRADLASVRVQLGLAETELRRAEELVQAKISSQSTLDQAKGLRDGLQVQVDELARLVTEGETSFRTLQSSNMMEIASISEAPIRAAIAVEESKLRLTEAELSPILLKAPMDGIVTSVFLRGGEAVVAGQPIVAIAAANPVRIVGYLRPPITHEPQPGARVEVRTRGLRRQTGAARVLDVGVQFEAVPIALMGPIKLGGIDLGLPVGISLPANLNIRPGELVDILLHTEVN
jgi:multidrug resistance efflux pump